MDNSNEQLFDGIGRLRQNKNKSKAASVTVTEEPMVTVSMKEYRLLLAQDGKCANTIDRMIRQSKAASQSVAASGINKVQVIHDFITKGF